MPADDSTRPHGHVFATTRWSVVLAAGAATVAGADALAVLCGGYWYPLYAFVRRQGHAPHDAQDLTQEFFARLIAKEWLGGAVQERGRFRSFLLAAMKHFLANEWRDAQRLKRGGTATFVPLETGDAEERYLHEPAEPASAEQVYDRRWALDLLERGLARLAAEFAAAGKTAHFEALKFSLTGEQVAGRHAAARLGTTEGAVKVAVHRLRERYRELIRAEIAETVDGPERIEEELQELQAALRG